MEKEKRINYKMSQDKFDNLIMDSLKENTFLFVQHEEFHFPNFKQLRSFLGRTYFMQDEIIMRYVKTFSQSQYRGHQEGIKYCRIIYLRKNEKLVEEYLKRIRDLYNSRIYGESKSFSSGKSEKKILDNIKKINNHKEKLKTLLKKTIK